MNNIIDVLFTVIHLLIIIFNVVGWIFTKTRKFHLVFVVLTLFSWVVLGIWFGFGYCPVTDWQWRVKEAMGEHNLPASFITYFVNNMLGGHFSDALVTKVTGIVFLLVIVATAYVNFFRTKRI